MPTCAFVLPSTLGFSPAHRGPIKKKKKKKMTTGPAVGRSNTSATENTGAHRCNLIWATTRLPTSFLTRGTVRRYNREPGTLHSVWCDKLSSEGGLAGFEFCVFVFGERSFSLSVPRIEHFWAWLSTVHWGGAALFTNYHCNATHSWRECPPPRPLGPSCCRVPTVEG